MKVKKLINEKKANEWLEKQGPHFDLKVIDIKCLYDCSGNVVYSIFYKEEK